MADMSNHVIHKYEKSEVSFKELKPIHKIDL